MDALELVEWLEEMDEEDVFVAERRQYRMLERVQVDLWDDYDFIYRFRLSKSTFAVVLEMVRADLEWIQPRYCILYILQCVCAIL